MAYLEEIIKPLLSLLGRSKLKNLSLIVLSLVSMSGNKTMLNISRWTQGELSYRSIQRFFADNITWLDLRLKMFMLNILVMS